MNFNRTRWAAFGAVTAIVAGGAGGIGFAQAAGNSSASSFVSTVPCRVLDTRSDSVVGGIGPAAVFTLDARSALVDCAIPADATGLSVNIAAVGATADTFLTAYPHATARPVASHLNVSKGVVTSNGVDVKLSDDGKLDIYNQSGTVNVIIDVLGAYVPAASGTGSSGAPGAAGPQGDAGAQGPTGEQGPAGPAYREVPIEIEVELRYSDSQYATYQWSGPLDVCGDDIAVATETTSSENSYEYARLFNLNDNNNQYFYGFGNVDLFGSDSIDARIERYETQPEGGRAPTMLLSTTVLCGPDHPVDGEFDGVADNDIADGYGDMMLR